MQGYQPYQEKLFSTINLREMIPANHLLLKVNNTINFSFIYELTEDLYCKRNGRPSIDPVLFFRMQMIGYLYGIKSDRQLCEEIQLNLAYRWFCGLNLEDKVPEHSSLTRIRDRFGVETYQAIFEKLLSQWIKTGVVKGKSMMSDASLVEANASLDSLVQREDGDPNARALKMYERQYHDFKEGKKQRTVSNQTHVSRTDPDATMVSRQGYHRKLTHKVHYSMDAKSRIITDCYVTTGAKHECTVLPERVEYHISTLGLTPQEWIADRGYGRGPTYAFLRGKNIRNYIPLHDINIGSGLLNQGDFNYDRATDRYRCPENHYLYPYNKPERNSVRRYRMLGRHCRECVLSTQCLPESQKHRARFIYRNLHQDEINRVRRRQKTSRFKKKLIERKWKIEGLFAEAKQYHGLRRAKYRGLKKFQIQCYMTALVQNIKRIIQIIFVFFYFLMFKKFSNLFKQIIYKLNCNYNLIFRNACLV